MALPLASVLVYSLKISPAEFWQLILKENVRNAFITSITSSFIAAIINVVFGLIVAWTLVKYEHQPICEARALKEHFSGGFSRSLDQPS